MNKTIPIIIIAITFIWAGMICGISFLEAPLKFQAPGITLPLGLGIGKLVFGALTKIEMTFSLFIITCLLLSKVHFKTWKLFVIPILIVIIDNALLMPILDARIDLILIGVNPPESSAHWWYVGLELIKLISLVYAGVVFTKRLLNFTQSDL
jgi:hypothetical protein